MTLILIFAGCWIIGLAFVWFWTRKQEQDKVTEVRQRLEGTKKVKKKNVKRAQLLKGGDTETGRVVMNLLDRMELHARLQTFLEQAGMRIAVARFCHVCLGLFIASAAVSAALIPPAYRWGAFLVGVVFALAPMAVVRRKRNKRLRKFEEQFPESLEFVARSMRAGHAFSVSLEMLYKEFQEPLAGEFRRTFEEHNLGLPLDQALEKLSVRVPSLDVHFFVSAVLLQKRTGGNLAEILDKLAYTIRERFKIRGKIRAISAHGKVTGTALTSIPLGVASILFFSNPSYVDFFIADPAGQLMSCGAVGLQLLGYFIIQRIVQIEV